MQSPTQGRVTGAIPRHVPFLLAISADVSPRNSVLTPGNIADMTMALLLLQAIVPPRRPLADKAYDADSLRDWLRQTKVQAVIQSSAARRTPYPLDRKAYRHRNVIERLFCKLKNWRRIATRYDRLAQNYLSAIALISIVTAWV